MKLKLFGSVLARGEMKLKEKLCQINPIGWEDPKKYNGKVWFLANIFDIKPNADYFSVKKKVRFKNKYFGGICFLN